MECKPLTRQDLIDAFNSIPSTIEEMRDSVRRNQRINPRWFGCETMEELAQAVNFADVDDAILNEALLGCRIVLNVEGSLEVIEEVR